MNFNISEPTDAYNWQPEDMLEITLPDPDSFLKVRETLSRIGVASKHEQTLYQSCHILHRQGRYFICSFKEMFLISGKDSNITVEDIRRRNTIAKLLEQWGLCKILVEGELMITPISSIKIVPYKEKKNWNLIQKFTMYADRKPKL
jgi:hypothetical protein